MVLLAIDYGQKNIGLAISEDGLVKPLLILRNNNIKVFSKLKEICQKNRIEKIVLGFPDGRLQKLIREFSKKLGKMLKIPIILHDETLSTKEAIQKMREAGKKQSYIKRNDHLFAACLILESYLEQAD